MRIEQLEYLVEVSKNRSISAASDKLHLTPQALSLSLKNLETYLGVTLLNRTYKGVFLTEEGKILVQVSQNLFDALADLKNKSKFADGLMAEIHYLTSQEESGTILPAVLGGFYKKYPKAKLHASKYSREVIISKILTKESSLAFIYCQSIDGKRLDLDEPELKFVPFLRNKVVCQVSRELPISVYNTISISALADIPVIIYHPKNSNNYSILDTICHYIQPKNLIFEDNCALIKQMVATGLGVTFTINAHLATDCLANTSANIVNTPLKENIEFEFGALYHQGNTLSAEEQLLVDFVRDFIQMNTSITADYIL